MKTKKRIGMFVMMAFSLMIATSMVFAAAPMYKASGGGTADWPLDRVTYGFTASADADGNVKGQFQAQHRDVASFTTVHGDVTHLHVNGNMAWIGGVVTHADDETLIGNEFMFSVTDNGQGKNAAPDTISALNYFATAADVMLEPAMGGVDLTNGNIKVS